MKRTILAFLGIAFFLSAKAQYFNLLPGKALLKSQHSVGAVDIFFGTTTTANPCNSCSTGYNYFNINSAALFKVYSSEGNIFQDSSTYSSLIRSLNFNSLQYSGGSTAHWDHFLPGTLEGKGYNDLPSELTGTNDCPPDLCSDQYNKGTSCFSNDFFEDYITFIHNLGVGAAIIANAHKCTNPNLVNEIIAKMNYEYNQTGHYPMRVSLGAEESALPSCWKTANTYSNFIAGWFSTNNLENWPCTYVVDDDPPYSANYKGWDEAIVNNEELTKYCHEGRLYLWDDDVTTMTIGHLASSTADLDKLFGNNSGSIPLINEFFNYANGQTFGKWLDAFPSSSGIAPSVWQWGIRNKYNGSNDPCYESMLGCMYIARFYQWMESFQWTPGKIIPYASFQNLNDLLNINYIGGKDQFHLKKKNFYEAFNLVGMLYGNLNSVKYIVARTNVNSNVYAIATGNAFTGNKGYVFMLVVNEDSTAQTLQPMRFQGVVPSHQTLTQYFISSKTLMSAASHFNPDTIFIPNPGATNISLPGYSVNVLVYKFGNSAPERMQGFENTSDSMTVEVYPNPATDRLFVDASKSSGQFNVYIYNMRSELCKATYSAVPLAEINTSALPSGIYIVKVFSPGFSPRYERFVKQ